MTLGIYIQVPFCQTKCTYCNFQTGVVSRDRYQPYVDAVCREIAESGASFLGGLRFESRHQVTNEKSGFRP